MRIVEMEEEQNERQDALVQDEVLEEQITPEHEASEVQDLLHQLPQEMLVKALAGREGNVSLTVEQQISHQQYSGPIPPPSMLNDYNKVQSGFAERIVSMAENEQKHRHELESHAVKGAITKDKRSQRFALICVLFISTLCGGLIYTGHDTAGSFLGGSTLVGLAALFITGRRDTSKKQDEQSNEEQSGE